MRLLRLVSGASWRVLRSLLLTLAALWFFFEEFGWHPLAAWLGSFTRWPPWARMEARIARVPARPALLLFLLPAAALLPVKLLAVQLIQDGHPVTGLIVIVAAKLLGTAIGGRLFMLMRKQLMTLRRFARAMAWWRQTRRRVRRALEASAGWRAMRAIVARWRLRLSALFH
ncbi:MAG: hypothetical protein ABI781_12545 [Burkholderiales bacterium]